MVSVRLHRVYDTASEHGPRYLVERLWPRGVRKDSLAMDGWLKDVAPSSELRRWFDHDPVRWGEFRRRYTAELDAQPEAWAPLMDAATSPDGVTLLYSSRDQEHNNAVVLREYLLGRSAHGI